MKGESRAKKLPNTPPSPVNKRTIPPRLQRSKHLDGFYARLTETVKNFNRRMNLQPDDEMTHVREIEAQTDFKNYFELNC